MNAIFTYVQHHVIRWCHFWVSLSIVAGSPEAALLTDYPVMLQLFRTQTADWPRGCGGCEQIWVRYQCFIIYDITKGQFPELCFSSHLQKSRVLAKWILYNIRLLPTLLHVFLKIGNKAAYGAMQTGEEFLLELTHLWYTVKVCLVGQTHDRQIWTQPQFGLLVVQPWFDAPGRTAGQVRVPRPDRTLVLCGASRPLPTVAIRAHCRQQAGKTQVIDACCV